MSYITSYNRFLTEEGNIGRKAKFNAVTTALAAGGTSTLLTNLGFIPTLFKLPFMYKTLGVGGAIVFGGGIGYIGTFLVAAMLHFGKRFNSKFLWMFTRNQRLLKSAKYLVDHFEEIQNKDIKQKVYHIMRKLKTMTIKDRDIRDIILAELKSTGRLNKVEGMFS